ncbi:hypothetical protein QQ008_01090 [Fulvivirgaceae bacterium BMA10]|uniref:Uncharacterized protein n=1 Tax=Splendidivirga corallicola TaxID=3051826 RepID=A0ABT8KGS9_9BACT|nr:hypothetical protein [Fulvivirgaceae bacterium BMA10]
MVLSSEYFEQDLWKLYRSMPEGNGDGEGDDDKGEQDPPPDPPPGGPPRK